MGSKSSKGGAKSPVKGGAAPKIALPPKKVKKDSPFDLTYFKFLGGVVQEEFEEVSRDAAHVKVLARKLEPPKPIGEMSEAEKTEWEAEVEKHEKKLAMQKLMEKNIQLKIQHGGKPVEPPVKGGIVGKAKKKIKQTQEKVAAKAEAATRQEETVEVRVKKQALAGAQGSLTGGATASLGQDIAKSQQIKDLEKKRKEYAKQEELKKTQEEEARKKAEEEKKKAKPKGLADFLTQAEGPVAHAAAQENTVRKSAGPAAKLNAFLAQVEGPAYAQEPVVEKVQVSEEPLDEKAKQPQVNKLNAFLASTETQTERPKSVNKLSGFLGATARRLSFKPDANSIDPPPENNANTENENSVAPTEGEKVEENPSKTSESTEERIQSTKMAPVLNESETTERPKSESKFAGFLGATVRRLTFKPADTLNVDMQNQQAQMEALAEDEGGAAATGDKQNIPKNEEVESTSIAVESEQAEAKTERPKSEGPGNGSEEALKQVVPAAEAATESTTEPTTEPATVTAAEAATESTTEPATAPAAEAATEAAAEPALEPAASDS